MLGYKTMKVVIKVENKMGFEVSDMILEFVRFNDE
jgi:hypothetical protein